MNSFKQQCIELRQKDHTLNEIVRITGRSKTTVYFHIKDIDLSAEKRAAIRANSRRRAMQLARSRKGKSARSFKPFDVWTPPMVLLVAHLMFDGEILCRRCVYNNRSQALISRVQKLMRRCYSYDPAVRKVTKSGVTTIAYHNVALSAYLLHKANGLLTEIPHLSLRCRKEFLRAFFDDEGCMDFNGTTRRIRGYQKDKKILVLVQRLLQDFHISAKLQGKNEIVITGKDGLRAFQNAINFSPGVCLNPKRTNSIWKQDIEKRTLLNQAIKSFKS